MPSDYLLCILRKELVEQEGQYEELDNELVQFRVVILEHFANMLPPSPAVKIGGPKWLASAEVFSDSLDTELTKLELLSPVSRPIICKFLFRGPVLCVEGLVKDRK